MISLDSITQIVVGSIAVALIAGLSFVSIKLFVARKRLTNLLVQAMLDKVVLNEALEKMSEKYESLSLQGSDGFVKFLSQSREWAFNYIEEVQQSIVELDAAMNSLSEERISAAYKRLLEHLPKEEAGEAFGGDKS